MNLLSKKHTRKNKKNAGGQGFPKRILLLPALFLLFLTALFLHYYGGVLVVYDPGGGEVFYRLPVKRGDILTLEYTHSVTGRVVYGTFEVTDAREIKPLTTSFDTYGPGLPYPDDSLEYIEENGMFTIFHQEAPREKIGLFVSPLTAEYLSVGNRRLNLGDLKGGPFLLHIRVMKHWGQALLS